MRTQLLLTLSFACINAAEVVQTHSKDPLVWTDELLVTSKPLRKDIIECLEQLSRLVPLDKLHRLEIELDSFIKQTGSNYKILARLDAERKLQQERTSLLMSTEEYYSKWLADLQESLKQSSQKDTSKLPSEHLLTELLASSNRLVPLVLQLKHQPDEQVHKTALTTLSLIQQHVTSLFESIEKDGETSSVRQPQTIPAESDQLLDSMESPVQSFSSYEERERYHRMQQVESVTQLLSLTDQLGAREAKNAKARGEQIRMLIERRDMVALELEDIKRMRARIKESQTKLKKILAKSH